VTLLMFDPEHVSKKQPGVNEDTERITPEEVPNVVRHNHLAPRRHGQLQNHVIIWILQHRPAQKVDLLQI